MRDCNVLLTEDMLNDILEGRTVSIQKNAGHGNFIISISAQTNQSRAEVNQSIEPLQTTKEALEMPVDIKKKDLED